MHMTFALKSPSAIGLGSRVAETRLLPHGFVCIGMLGMLTALGASSVRAQDSSAGLERPVIQALQRVPLPPEPSGVTFGEIEFLPPDRPAPPRPRPPAPAPPKNTVTFGEVEFEVPAGEGFPPGTTRSHDKATNSDVVSLPDGTRLIEHQDGSVTRINTDGTVSRSGGVTFGEFEFEKPPPSIGQLKKSVKAVLDKQRKAQKAIDRELDELEKKKKGEAAKRWHARNIPGGNAQVGVLRSQALADAAIYTAPVTIIGDPVVPVQVKPGVAEKEELSGAALVTVLDTDAVLEARWSFEEVITTSLNKTERSYAGTSITADSTEQRVVGSGLVRFEERPPPGTARAEWEQSRSFLSGQGRRNLLATAADGGLYIAGGYRHAFSGPKRSEQSDGVFQGSPRSPRLPADVPYNVTLVRSGKGWRLDAWFVNQWRPELVIGTNASHRSRTLEQQSDASYHWIARAWTTSDPPGRRSFDIYTPVSTPDRTPSPGAKVGRIGSTELRPAGPGRFTGRLSLSFAIETPDDGKSTNRTQRRTTWDFTLEIEEPAP
ncbi:hypothetical protein [Horticoccus sp. 23ND18S-11]|uniref:hypothetical protein n=1 Tax=Horticoccus sp. 23ND18S-11 TaxID=3391832 RepID=UPI0039C9EE05